MTYEIAFLALNALFFIPWFFLFTSNEPRFTMWQDHPSFLWFMSILYAILIAYSIYLHGGLTNMFDFEALKSSFQRDEVMLLAWLHYLVFDLFVGIHIQQKICKKALYIRIPILVLCLMLGPLGYAVYVLQSGVQAKKG